MQISHSGHKGGSVLTAKVIAQFLYVGNNLHALGVYAKRT